MKKAEISHHIYSFLEYLCYTPHMELNHLRYFYEVAKSGSFTEAARRLHVSQSALSKAVAQLEGAEGVQLFVRSKSGVALTRIGSDVFARAGAIFTTLREIEDTCRGTKSVYEGLLHFGASDHIINYLLIKPLATLVKAHPKVVPSLINGGPNEITAALLGNLIEFGLFFTRVNVPQLEYEPIMTIEMVVVHRPSIKRPPGTTGLPHLRKFINEAGFISSVGSQYQHHPSASLAGQLGDFPPLIFECNGQEGQKRFCREVGGVAYLARFMVEKELKAGTLVEYPLSKRFELELLLARRKSRPFSLNAQAFLSELKGEPLAP